MSHHIGRFDIAVHYASAMRVRKRSSQALTNAQDQSLRQQPRGMRIAAEVGAGHKLHGDPATALRLTGGQHRHDVRVREASRGIGFDEKAATRFVE